MKRSLLFLLGIVLCIHPAPVVAISGPVICRSYNRVRWRGPVDPGSMKWGYTRKQILNVNC